MNSELFTHTAAIISHSDLNLNLNDVILTSATVAKMDLSAKFNHNFSQIDFIWFHDKIGGTSEIPIAIRGKSKIPNSHNNINYVLLSPPIDVYYKMYAAAKNGFSMGLGTGTDVNSELANTIEKVIRLRARSLNISTNINNLYREWFVSTVINNIDRVEDVGL
jgi:hypothetical protein